MDGMQVTGTGKNTIVDGTQCCGDFGIALNGNAPLKQGDELVRLDDVKQVFLDYFKLFTQASGAPCDMTDRVRVCSMLAGMQVVATNLFGKDFTMPSVKNVLEEFKPEEQEAAFKRVAEEQRWILEEHMDHFTNLMAAEGN